MINDIIDGISIKLNEIFGDVEIYSENVKQGLVEPCFFIQHVTTTETPYLGNRKKRVVTFDVHYFGTSKEDMLSKSDEMMDGLEYITLINGDSIRGLNMSSQIVDDVLHFSIDYQMMLKTIKTLEPMNKLTLTQELGD